MKAFYQKLYKKRILNNNYVRIVLCLTYDLQPKIVEKTFVVSCFSDIRKETTSFLVVPKKPTRNDAPLVSDLKNTRPGTTRNGQERPETNQLMVESWGRGKGWMGVRI